MQLRRQDWATCLSYLDKSSLKEARSPPQLRVGCRQPPSQPDLGLPPTTELPLHEAPLHTPAGTSQPAGHTWGQGWAHGGVSTRLQGP